MKCVGTVVAINRYPVKSMAGERLSEADLRWHGIDGDRQYAFVRTADTSRFPWLSARDLSQLVLYRASFGDRADPRHSGVDVIAPDGRQYPLGAEALRERLSEDAGAPLALLQLGRGLYDAMPVSVITTATHVALDARHGAAIDPTRFRTNIIIDSDAREGDWQARQIVFGDRDDAARLLGITPIPRCALITIDPATATRDASILRTVAQEFGNRIGLYCAPAATGTIRVGDSVNVVDA